MMKRGWIVLMAVVFLVGLRVNPAQAFLQPPLNFGLTDVLDGAVPGPGTYFFEYIQAYQSDNFKDKDGKSIPGNPDVGFLLSFNQLAYVSNKKIMGGNVGLDFLLPLVAANASGTLNLSGFPPIAVNANSGVLGDFIIGPFIQWFPHKLMGRPYIHRLELDISLPTGQYDNEFLINPGSNIWVIEPYYAFTWFLTPRFSTSWRLHYTYNTENDDPYVVFKSLGINDIQPGQAFHFNYSFEYEVVKNLRLAATGYYLKQLTADELNGQKEGALKEQVFAIGPAIHWITKSGFVFDLKTQFESAVENRPEGTRTTFRMIYKF